MFSQFGQLEICCDAPPYAVVRACKRCGFHSPLDVRWCRMSHLLHEEGQRRSNLGVRFWMWLIGASRLKEHTCTCGQTLPDLKRYRFTILSKKVGDYLLGQCRHCRTVYWDRAMLRPAWLKERVVRLTDSLEM